MSPQHTDLSAPEKQKRSENVEGVSMKETAGELMRAMLRWSLFGVLFFGANTVLGLGLGRINVQSALNQPLAAEIQLLNSSEWLASDLKVGLAGQDAFERLGIERPTVLFDLEFKAVQRGSRVVIESITADAIVEPFLHFVLVLDWPRGRLFKEYIVLLDLPSTQGVVQPLISRADSEGKPFRATEQFNPMEASGSGSGRLASIVDTCWDLACASRPYRFKTNPQTSAFYKANPEVAIDQNINQLKTLPSRGYPVRGQGDC